MSTVRRPPTREPRDPREERPRSAPRARQRPVPEVDVASRPTARRATPPRTGARPASARSASPRPARPSPLSRPTRPAGPEGGGPARLPRLAGLQRPPRTGPSRGERRRASPQRRTTGLLVLSVLAVVGLLAMLVRLQVVEPERYVAKGVGQRQIRTTLVGLRGSIVDRNGETLAMSLPARAVTADPRYVTNPEKAANVLAPILGMEVTQIRAALERPDTGFSYVARQLDAEIGEEVERLGLPGVYVVDESRRVTAADGLAMSIVGRMDPFGEVASFGLEQSMDETLRGHDGLKLHERGADGGTIVGSERIERAPSAGGDVRLTIDRSLQFWAETALAEQVAKVGAGGATAIVGRPATGEVLAMASVVAVGGEVRTSQLNLAVRTYEPGSVMKLVTAAAGFEQGVVDLDTVFTVPPKIQVADKIINDSHKHPTEPMTVQEIIAQSSNVGTIKIAQLVGRQGILDALDDFGFGKMTSLGLQKEQTGEFRRKWYGSDIGSIPIGQSITATPLQIWNSYNTIANRGLAVEPRLVESVTDADGTVTTTPTKPPRRVVSAATATKVTQALEKVVEDGTGKEWSIPGYNIAAKTGTAYQPIPGTRGYGTNGNRHYAATFAGFFPASDPQLSIIVMVDDPKTDYFGADAAGPVFDRLAKEAMRRYGIAGDVAVAGLGGPVKAQAAQPTTTTSTTIPGAAAGTPLTPVAGAQGGADPALVADPAVAADPATTAPLAGPPDATGGAPSG